VSHVEFVCDTSKNDFLKGTARPKRRKGVRRRVVGKAAVPGNWQNITWVDSNKTELFSVLSSVLLQEDKEVLFTDGKGVLSMQLLHHTMAPQPQRR